VLERRVRRQHGVVRLNDRAAHPRGRVYGKLELAFLAIVSREALEEERAKAGARTTAERVEDEEALETRAGIGELAEAVEDSVDELLADSVVTSGVVVGGILLSSDEGLWVEERAVLAGPDGVDHVGLEVDVDGARDVFAAARLGEEGREAIVGLASGCLDPSLWGQAVLVAVELPTGVTDLNTSLADVDGNDLAHGVVCVLACVRVMSVCEERFAVSRINPLWILSLCYAE